MTFRFLNFKHLFYIFLQNKFYITKTEIFVIKKEFRITHIIIRSGSTKCSLGNGSIFLQKGCVKSKCYNIQFVDGTLKLTHLPGEIIF